MTNFGVDEIRIGEAVERSVAHLAAACELYGMGRKPDALLQAARPITDVLPALETEIRSADEALSRFFGATAAVGSEIRANATPRSVRKAFKKADESAHDLLVAALGEVAQTDEPGFRASIGVALLDGAVFRYRSAVDDENLGDYQAAYSIADRATGIILDCSGGRLAEMDELISGANALLPSVEPPEKLPSPDAVEKLVAGITAAAIEGLGAQRATWTLEDSAKRIDRLLIELLDAYEKGLGPLAARLAASLFVRSYDPIRREIAAVNADAEARLTSLLGFELRRAINDEASSADIQKLVDEAKALLATLRTQLAT